MNKRESIRNKNFKSVRDKLEYIQKKCYETELFEDLKQLFKHKGFSNVKITHGNTEYGKDLVFSKFDENFGEERWYAAIVKNKNASQNDFMDGNEIGNQIRLASTIPYVDIKGDEKIISGIFVIINGSVSANATTVISKYVHSILLPHIKIWDYQDLDREISKHSKDSFLDNLEPAINTFVQEQIQILSNISSSSEIYDLKLEDINEIFVNVQTTYSKELRKINNYVTFENEQDKFKEEDVEGSNEILNSNKNFIIHGIATSGKSLFLRRIGIKALSANLHKLNAVFFLDLQNFKSEDFNLLDLIKQQYSDLTKGEDFEFENYSKIVILLDSIDFIKSDLTKIRILKEIDKFVASKQVDNVQIIIATRNLELLKNNKLLSTFSDTELLPFNFNQALKLVKKIIPNDNKKANTFIQAIKNTLLDTSLQRTPLALTLMAILYRDDKIDLKELPANIYELYNKFTDVYLDRWDTSKGLTQFYKYEQIKNILAFISLHMHKEGINIITTHELKCFLSELRKSYNYDELNDIQTFITHLKSKNGVFSYNSVLDTFQFYNHYFQEFFASLSIEDDEDSILIDNFFNGWWSNALIFYCGKNPKSYRIHNQILNKIVPLNIAQKLFYINQQSKCLQASHAISIENRTKTVKKILFEFDAIFAEIMEEANTNMESILNKIPFVQIINQSKTLFDNVFGSKHIATAETISFFEGLLVNDEGLSNLTIYNISYFLAFHQNSPVAFELFEDKINDDIVWNRILFVDINFLKLKKKIGEKTYIRIKRKMFKNKFLIQHILSSNIASQASLKE